MPDTLSAYEKERLANIESNERVLVELGVLQAAAAARPPRKPKQPRAERKPAPQGPRRASGRLNGDVLPELFDGGPDLDELDRRAATQPGLKRASDVRRLTAEQMQRLDSLEPTSAAALSAEEAAAIDLAREDVAAGGTAGGWKAHKAKGTNMYTEKRTLLKEAAASRGLRWPSWLGKIQGALPPMGSTDSARDQSMFAIERAACGFGLDYKHWPAGVGVLLAGEETAEGAAAPLPRILTLGSDTERLKREGQKLEARFGRDAGNGWVYNHALGKLRLYQELLLREHFGDAPSAQSIREMEEAEAEEEAEERAAAREAGEASPAVEPPAGIGPPPARGRVVVPKEDFINDGDEFEEYRPEAERRPRPAAKQPAKQKRGRARRAEEVEAEAAPPPAGGDEEDEEDAPLSKRRRQGRASQPASPASSASPAASAAATYAEGDRVSSAPGRAMHGRQAKWFPARIDAVNEDGTYDLVYEDGDEEDGVAAKFIRPAPK